MRGETVPSINPAISRPLRPLLDGRGLRRALPAACAWFDELVGAGLASTEYVRDSVRLAIAVRRAVLADDYPLLQALGAEARTLGVEPAYVVENGVELGVAVDELRAFTERHLGRPIRRPENFPVIDPDRWERTGR